MLETDVESSKTIIISAMMIGLTTLKEEMANMKAILENSQRKSKEKEARIKLQEEKIAQLTKKLKKRWAQSSVKGSESGDLKKVSIHT